MGGGKGGVGKTGLMAALAEWFEAHEIPFTLLDLDTENKARGSLKHFFNGSVTKVNIHTPAGLDSFIDYLESGASIVFVHGVEPVACHLAGARSHICEDTFPPQARGSLLSA